MPGAHRPCVSGCSDGDVRSADDLGQFAATALVIVLAGVRLARYGDVLGEKSGLGRSWIGVVLPALGWVGLCSPVLIVLYFVAMRVIFAHEQHRRLRESQEVAKELQYAGITLRSAVVHYSLAAIAVVAAALWLPRLGAELARQTGLGEAFVGSLFIAITTSLPEIVVSLAAVRIGAIDLGIGNVLGSNLFNLLILGLDDVFYRQGPLMADAGASHGISIVAVVMMNALFLIGLTCKLMQQKPGFSKSSVVVGVLLAASLAARQADQQPPARSTMSGVYSAQQAAKGEELYLTLCTGCHSSRTYASLNTAWTGRPVLELFDLVQTTMPKNDAGSLTSEETAQILAFMLKINRVPAGKTDLSASRTELAQIRFEFPAGH